MFALKLGMALLMRNYSLFGIIFFIIGVIAGGPLLASGGSNNWPAGSMILFLGVFFLWGIGKRVGCGGNYRANGDEEISDGYNYGYNLGPEYNMYVCARLDDD